MFNFYKPRICSLVCRPTLNPLSYTSQGKDLFLTYIQVNNPGYFFVSHSFTYSFIYSFTMVSTFNTRSTFLTSVYVCNAVLLIIGTMLCRRAIGLLFPDK